VFNANFSSISIISWRASYFAFEEYFLSHKFTSYNIFNLKNMKIVEMENREIEGISNYLKSDSLPLLKLEKKRF
jgi:hypothetical protein